MAEIVKHNRQDSGSVHRCSAVDDMGLMLVVAQATDATHAVAEFLRHRPDITLIDGLSTPGRQRHGRPDFHPQ
jgi:hypothetical protein